MGCLKDASRDAIKLSCASSKKRPQDGESQDQNPTLLRTIPRTAPKYLKDVLIYVWGPKKEWSDLPLAGVKNPNNWLLAIVMRCQPFQQYDYHTVLERNGW